MSPQFFSFKPSSRKVVEAKSVIGNGYFVGDIVVWAHIFRRKNGELVNGLQFVVQV